MIKIYNIIKEYKKTDESDNEKLMDLNGKYKLFFRESLGLPDEELQTFTKDNTIHQLKQKYGQHAINKSKLCAAVEPYVKHTRMNKKRIKKE